MDHLSKPQKLIYDMEKYAGGSINVICGVMLTKEEKSVSAMQAAVNEIFRLNSALRTRIIETGAAVMQTAEDFSLREFPVRHFESKAALDEYAQAYAKVPFDFHGPLCEIQIILVPEKSGILVKFHHIVGDAWTIALIGTQFNTLIGGEQPKAYSYLEYLDSEEAYWQSPRCEKDRAFFLEQFQRCREVTYLSEKQSSSFSAKRKTFVLAGDEARKVSEYVSKAAASPFALFLTALAVYISRIKQNAEKFYIGTAVLNRSGVREKNTMGMFVNTVPLLMELDYEKTFAENLSAVKTMAVSALRHQKFNYGDTLSAIRKEYGFTEKLYDVMLSYQNAAIAGAKEESTWYHSGAQSESLEIHIDDRDSENIFRIHFDYQTEKFTEAEIERMYGQFLTLLFDAVEHEDKKLSELELLSPAEKQKLLIDFNATAGEYPREKTVHRLFEEQAERTPDKTAVIACDRALTYRELNEEANRIAHGLLEQGVQPGDIVAFALPRDSHLIPTMFGILKAGAAYLPIDPDYPQERIDFMLRDSRAAYFITEENLFGLLENANTGNPEVAIEVNTLFCALHTSGSTGKPKLSLLKHGGMVNFLTANQRFWRNVDTVVSATIVTFDAFTMESVLSVVQGYQVALASEADIYNQLNFEKLFQSSKQNMFFSTPTKIENYLDNSQSKEFLQRIQNLVIGGEIFNNSLLNKLKQYVPSCRVFNIYGPTETTICAVVDEVEQNRIITIGRPIANTQIYIVDKYMNPVPLGVTGELCIAGDGVGAGYLNRPELTAEKFIDNPFGEGKLYKTGDLAYWREDGNIVYVGRNDFQVKIRGLRIELGEIENALQGVEGVSQAVVVVRKDETGRQLICAFYTGREQDGKALRSTIGQKLPKYMLPHVFTHLTEMPLTPSGKVNRKALPEIDLHAVDTTAEYVAPVGEMEKRLAALMEQTLEYSPIGREDDFFDLGGDSLKAIGFVSKAHTEGIYFSLQNVFDHPTVRALRECIENGDKANAAFSKADFAEIDRVLAKNVSENLSIPPKQAVGNLLLTGATGFLGIHILAEFLEHDRGNVYCLVRGENKEGNEKRFIERLRFYFGEKYAGLVGERIKVICGDLQKEKFGLSEPEYQKLQHDVQTVIHSAATVKHYGSYRYFYEANVETTLRLIDFCKSGNARLIHISTLSVSGNSNADSFDGYISETEKHFSESNLFIGQPLDNVYARSKFEAEKAVLTAMTEGLQANIMRMGNLTNRASDGKFQINYETNAAAQRIKGALELGKIPDYLVTDKMYVEFTPVDEAARAVMTIVRHFSTEQTVFHINSTKVVYMAEFMAYFTELGYPLRKVSSWEFTEALRRTAKEAGMEHIFETFINDLDQDGKLNYDSNIRIENQFTEKYLNALEFHWGEIGLEYLRKYTRYFEEVGYFRRKSTCNGKNL